MKTYIKNFIEHYGIGEQDILRCQICGQVCVDIHHIKFKSQLGTDDVENLICLCRKDHDLSHAKKISNEELHKHRNNSPIG